MFSLYKLLDQPTSIVRSKVQKTFVSLPIYFVTEFGRLPVTVLQVKVTIVIYTAISYRQKQNNAPLKRDVLLKL